MKSVSKIVFVLCLITFVSSCRKGGDFEDIPSVDYKDYEFVEEPSTNRNSFVLNLYFTDGDGDIGEPEGTPFDTCAESGYNLRLRYFERVNNTYKEIFPLDECLPFHSQIPDITPEGQNKILEGDIFVTFPFAGFPQNATDSIKFEFVLVDRAGNLSEPELSQAIPLQ
jgi:hypothetical protein